MTRAHLHLLLALLTALVLLTLGWHQVRKAGEAGVPAAQPLQTEREAPLFSLRTPEETGVDFANRLGEDKYRNIIRYQYYYNGGGVAAGDVNNDGLPDLFFTGNVSPNRLYLNRGGFRFEDVTRRSGTWHDPVNSWCTGVTMVDINSDGYLDIYVSRAGHLQPENRRNLLYINNGDETFTERAAEYGLDDPGYSIQAAFFDYDRDGDLDLFLANHSMGQFDARDMARLRSTRDPFAGDKLFENREGRFVEVTGQAGIKSTAFGFALGVAVGDLNGDAWDDLYVSNDFFEPDYLYFNNGDGTFTESIKTATRHISLSSMGNDVADINGDGHLDIAVLDMIAEDNRRMKSNLGGIEPADFDYFVRRGYHYQYMTNTLHLNNGNETFSDIAQLAGVSNTDWSWAPLFADFDNDGWVDLFVTNGLRKDVRNIDFRNELQAEIEEIAADPFRSEMTDAEWTYFLNKMPSEKIANYMYKNKGDLTFSNVAAAWGLHQPTFSNGAAYADFDGDGDLDLALNNLDEVAYLYENHAAEREGANYLRIKLKGPAGNASGLGAKVRVRAGGREQMQQLFMSRGYQSSVEDVLHFGLGTYDTADEVVVDWPGRERTRLEEVPANRLLVIDYAEQARPASAEEPHEADPLFEDVTRQVGLDHRHLENPHDDFQGEKMLPHKMSTFGPGLAVGDVDGDGREDFYVGAAAGFQGELYLQRPDGIFRGAGWNQNAASEDQGAAFFDADSDGDLDLYVVSGGSEFERGAPELQDRLYLNDGRGRFSRAEQTLPEMRTSGSRVLPADYDGDGDLDLFVGGRLVPGHYAAVARSYLLENRGGTFEDITAEVAPELVEAGMVTDAVWTDFDRDGDLDLIVVGEWMPILFLENHAAPEVRPRFTAVEPLPNTNGWWFSIEAADYDGDGDDDYVLGNLGLNHQYKAAPEAPFRIYAHDFDGNGFRDLALSYYQEGVEYPLKGRDPSVAQVPSLRKKFPTHDAFATATMEDVYGEEALEKALRREVHTFASICIENEGGGRFRSTELPQQAQLSSVNAFLSRDLDEDGHLDLILAGNLHAFEVETVRSDAGIGLVLRGDGRGGFTSLPVNESGFFAPHDAKDLAWIESAQGPLVLVANNNHDLQVFRRKP